MVEFRLMVGRDLLTPARLLIAGYLLVITLGTILLMLPLSTSDGRGASFMVALFTATSAVCVTGLIVVDTATYYSFFGKSVILLLIQIGGLGSITAYAFILFLLGKKLSISQMLTLKSGMNLPHLGQLKRIVIVAVTASLIFEILGAILLLPFFYSSDSLAKSVFDAIFQAVSAFNNAGLSTFSDNLLAFAGKAPVVIVMSSLVIIGGLGFLVILDVYECHILRKRSSLTTHTKIVLSTTFTLLVIGFLLTLFFEWNNPQTIGEMPLWQKLLNGLTMSVFPRTAGFNTVDYKFVFPPTVVLTIILMAIGASPGGTGGGFKTSTLALALLAVINLFRGKAGTIIFNRKIPAKNLLNAYILIFVWIIVLSFATILLVALENFRVEDVLFEIASAFGTVGLSRGITASLGTFSQIVLIVLMIAGRVGPVTAGASLFQYALADRLHYPEDEILVG